jgi:hypothetical protein
MKSIIRLSALLLCLLGATATGWAQAPGHRPAPLSELIERHAADLELTETQIEQLTALDTETRAELDALRADESLTPDARRTAARELMEQTRAQVQAILTEAQQQQLRALRREQPSRRRPDPADREANRAQREALKAELATYRAENIAPVLRAQRQKLEEQLSPADQETLAQIRAELAADRAEREAEREARREQGEQNRATGTRPDREAGKARMAERRTQLREDREELRTRLEPLLTKYDAAITALLAEIATDREQWKADQKAIHEKYAPEQGDRTRRPRRRVRPGNRPDSAPHADAPDRMEMSKVRFLLLDPAAAAAAPGAAAAPRNSLSLYPNPNVSGTTTVTLRMQQAGPARVELRTESGRVLRVLADSEFGAGDHTLTVTTAGLRPGVYYLALSDAAGIRTERLVVN